MAQRYQRRGAVGAGSGGAKDFRPGSAGAVEKKNPTCGAHVSARGERGGEWCGMLRGGGPPFYRSPGRVPGGDNGRHRRRNGRRRKWQF